MYSASLQSYNNYNRRRTLAVSFVVNTILFVLFFKATGSILGSFQEQKPTHTVSIKNFNLTKAASHLEEPLPESSVKEPLPNNSKMQEVAPVEEISPPKKLKDHPKPAEKQPKKTTKVKKQQPVKAASKEVAKKPSKPQTTQAKITQATANKQQATQSNSQAEKIATDATHFGFQNPPPQYPMIAFQNNESGSVTIEYIVSSEGLVKDAKILESSGFPRLDRTALYAFKKWKFKPALTIAGAVTDSIPKKITFVFNIETQIITAE